jgi:quercetin dioxygenase-like cupin family protein
VNLAETFAVMKPNLSVDTVAVSPAIYQELDARYNQFKAHVLISSYEFEEDWGTWERHPAGDEIVVLLSGAARFRLRKPSGVEVVELREEGSFVVVPRNTWHTAEIDEKAAMLFVTPGEGTEHRDDL